MYFKFLSTVFLQEGKIVSLLRIFLTIHYYNAINTHKKPLLSSNRVNLLVKESPVVKDRQLFLVRSEKLV